MLQSRQQADCQATIIIIGKNRNLLIISWLYSAFILVSPLDYYNYIASYT